jgi:hypothetical protein
LQPVLAKKRKTFQKKTDEIQKVFHQIIKPKKEYPMKKATTSTSPNTINLAQRQIMLSFAYLAYSGELITTSNPGSTILGYINSAMPQIPPIASPNPTWEVVWGPVTYTVPGALLQDNMMYVVQNQTDTSQFAIAIRGTNFISQLNWMMDDFDLIQLMPWPPASGTTSNGQISEGANIGLAALLGMTWTNSEGTVLTLVDFLTQATAAANKTINICTTGHSLGGMLSSTLALYLYEIQSTWDPNNIGNISCISFAGPTAGNAEFATYSDSVFGAMTAPPNWDSSLTTNCDTVRCDLDIAPMAFVPANISNNNGSPILTIYGSNIEFSKIKNAKADAERDVFEGVLGQIATALTNQNYACIEQTSANLEGSFEALASLNPPVTLPSDMDDDAFTGYLGAFMAEAGYQHSTSYPNILNVPSVLNANIIVRT